MRRVSDVGAAVIGSGFIGTVHIEALRRLGVHGPRPARGSPGARGEADRRARPPPRLRHARRAARRRARRRRPRDVAERPPLPAGQAGSWPPDSTSSARSRSRTTSAESAELVRLAREAGVVNAVNFNIRFYPLNQHAAAMVRAGELGDVRLVTGHYFQDWLLLDTDWNWRLDPSRGRHAPRGRRHRHPLARPRVVRRRPAHRRASWPTWRRSSRCATSRPARSRPSRRSGPLTPSPARS